MKHLSQVLHVKDKKYVHTDTSCCPSLMITAAAALSTSFLFLDWWQLILCLEDLVMPGAQVVVAPNAPVSH